MNLKIPLTVVCIITSIGFAFSQPAFRAPQAIDGHHVPRSIVAGDFDGDGKNDLAYATSLGEIHVLFNNGEYSFTRETLRLESNEVVYFPLDTGDINGDGAVEIVAFKNYTAPTIEVLSFTGRSVQTTSFEMPSADPAVDMEVVDFNADGYADIVFNNSTMNVFYGSGDGSFDLEPITALPWHTHFAVADLNGDGMMDIVGTQDRLYIYLADGNGGYSSEDFALTSSYTSRIVLEDITGDAMPEILIHVEQETDVSIFVNQGDGSFVPSSVPFWDSTLGGTGTVRVADINSDDKKDFVVTSGHAVQGLINIDGENFDNLTLTGDRLATYSDVALVDLVGDATLETVGLSWFKILQMFSFDAGAFHLDTTLYLGAAPHDGIVTDLNGDMQPEVIYVSTPVLSIKSGESVQHFFGYVPNDIEFADFNSDGNLDVLTSSNKLMSTENYSLNFGSALSILYSNADGTTQEPYDLLPGGNAVGVGDFNNDGHADIVTRDLVLEGDGAGNFNPEALALPFSAIGAVSGDLNNDTFDDVVFFNLGTHVCIALNDGSGNFAFTEKLVDTNFQTVEIKDIDNDQLPDILIAGYASPPLHVLKNTGDGNFEMISFQATSFSPWAWDFADFNNDELLDLVRIDNTSFIIRLQMDDGSFADEVVFALASYDYPSGLATYDWNADGKLDVVLFSTAEFPIRVFLNDFVSDPVGLSSDLAISNRTSTLATFVIGTEGAGDKQMILIREGQAVDGAPVDGTHYISSSAFGEGDEVGPGNFVLGSIENGELPITGLEPNTTYHIAVYEHNHNYDETVHNYSSSGSTASFTTKKTQSIEPVNDVVMASAGETVIAVLSTSGLPVSLVAVSGDVSIQDNEISIHSPGPVTVLASQSGDDEYDAAPQAELEFCANPEVPTILREEQSPNFELTLTSSSPGNNQWYLDAVLIDGANESVYAPVANGVYHVKVDYDGCFSASDTETVTGFVFQPVKHPLQVTVQRHATDAMLTISGEGATNIFVILREGAEVDEIPSDGSFNFDVSLTFGEGDTFNDASALVYYGDVAPITISGLEEGTVYHGAVFQYALNDEETLVNFNPDPVVFSFVTKTSQELVFNSDDILFDPAQQQSVIVTSTSGLAVTLEKVLGDIAIDYNTITVNGPGPVQVMAMQSGDDTFDEVSAELSFCVLPPVPTITEGLDEGGSLVLISSSDVNNQWFKNGAPIDGADGKELKPASSGSFQVVVDFAGCPNQSEEIVLLITSIEEPVSRVHAYPNPVNDVLIIELGSARCRSLSVLDGQGRVVRTLTAEHESTVTVDMSTCNKGIYLVRVLTETETFIVRTVKK